MRKIEIESLKVVYGEIAGTHPLCAELLGDIIRDGEAYLNKQREYAIRYYRAKKLHDEEIKAHPEVFGDYAPKFSAVENANLISAFRALRVPKKRKEA